VRLPSKSYPLNDLVKESNEFFSKELEYKNKYTLPFGFGYSQFSHKEGFRILTGNRYRADFKNNKLIPEELNKMYEELVSLDKMCMLIIKALAEPVFGRTPSSLAHLADIPVAYLHQSHFGMLDTALYFNNQSTSIPPPPMGTSISDVNCVPHYDPGLFSISFFVN